MLCHHTTSKMGGYGNTKGQRILQCVHYFYGMVFRKYLCNHMMSVVQSFITMCLVVLELFKENDSVKLVNTL